MKSYCTETIVEPKVWSKSTFLHFPLPSPRRLQPEFQGLPKHVDGCFERPKSGERSLAAASKSWRLTEFALVRVIEGR